ncbi:uncharacterized protein TNCV_2089231 [Trichonephila clavipes]|nr:uncharacterized protein TNCV_2089231 [Trichonephila clavipes]
MNWLAISPDLKPREHALDALWRSIATRNPFRERVSDHPKCLVQIPTIYTTPTHFPLFIFALWRVFPISTTYGTAEQWAVFPIWRTIGKTAHRVGSQRSPITSSREDRHVTRMALMGHAASSRALNQELGSFARQQVLARTVRQLFLAASTLNSETMAAAILDIASLTGHQVGHIHVWRHHGECSLTACIRHRHTGQSPGVVVWVAIEYTSRPHLVRFDGTLNDARYISDVLRPVTLPFIRALRNPTFQ